MEARERGRAVPGGPAHQGAGLPAHGFREARRDVARAAPAGSPDECADETLARRGFGQHFIDDTGGGPTAVGAGHYTGGLERVLVRAEFEEASGPAVLCTSGPGPAAVGASERAGLGAGVTVTADTEVEDRHSGPLIMTGAVHAARQVVHAARQ